MPSPRVSELLHRTTKSVPPASPKYLAAIILLAMKQFAEEHPDKSLPKVMREVEKEWEASAEG